jgi:hypothetical protein
MLPLITLTTSSLPCTVDRTAIFPCTTPQPPGLPILSHPEINAKHPSSWWLGKGFSSDDIGDGPPKKPTKASAKRSQSLMTRFLHAPPDTSTTTLHAWAETQPCHVSQSPTSEHMIFACSTVAIAIAVSDLPAATSRLQTLTNYNETTPAQLQLLLDEIPIAVALRVNADHQRSTPETPHDATMLLAELLLGRPMNNAQQLNHNQDMTMALQVMKQRCQDWNLMAGQQAMERHLQFRTFDAMRDQITVQDKMAPSLFLAVAMTTETAVELWEEALTHSPFRSGWMQATQPSAADAQTHELSTCPARHLLENCLKTDSVHIGYAEGHHFRISYEHHELTTNLTGLLINLGRHLTTRVNVAVTPSLQPSITARLQEEQDLVSIFLPPHLFDQVRRGTHLIPRNDLPHAIKTL